MEMESDSVEDKLMRKAQLLSRVSCFQEWLRFHVEEELFVQIIVIIQNIKSKATICGSFTT